MQIPYMGVYISFCINWFRDCRSLRFLASTPVDAFFILRRFSYEKIIVSVNGSNSYVVIGILW